MVKSASHVSYYNGHKYNSIPQLHKIGEMHGVKRVATFCIMTTVLPTVLIVTPLYLRHSVFADVTYPVAESDVLAISKGVSSIFCESHVLRMNTSFNAFQIKGTPELSNKRKHIRLKKSMTLPDDTLEYWGFYLLKGATVKLKVCSRYEGSRILVVRGEKNLRTCGLLQHNLKKPGAVFDEEHNQVKVTFETAAQEITDTEDNTIHKNNTATEDNSEFEEPKVFVRTRINKPKTNIISTTKATPINDTDTVNSTHHRRHTHRNFLEKQRQLYKLQQALRSDEDIDMRISRPKRDTTGQQILDGGIEHGGNALNYADNVESGESSASSFETNLLTCYDGQILLSEGFSPSILCTDVHYLEKSDHMETIHEVASDGYYYYIFYSDNDYVSNDIHAVFDIYKPTYRYANTSKHIECINSTECHFPISFWSDETVIVEVPTRDGIEHEDDDITPLFSTCQPRMSVYIIFPVSVLFLILGCAFL